MKHQNRFYSEQIMGYISLDKPISSCRQERKTKKMMLEDILNTHCKLKSSQGATVIPIEKIESLPAKQNDTEHISPVTTLRMFNHALSDFHRYAQKRFSESKIVKTEISYTEMKNIKKCDEKKLFHELIYLKKSNNVLHKPKVLKLGTQASQIPCERTRVNKSLKIQDISIINPNQQLRKNRNFYGYSPRSQLKKKFITLRQQQYDMTKRSTKNCFTKKQPYIPNSFSQRKD